LAITACDPLRNQTGIEGELGNGKFTYECAAVADPLCDNGETEIALDNDIAKGSRFEMKYRARDSGMTGVVSASDVRLEELSSSSGVFEAKEVGKVGIVARRGSTDLDILHVYVAEVDHLEIEAGLATNTPTVTTSFDADAGDHIVLRGFAVDDRSNLLAGALDCQWSVDDPTLVSIDSLEGDNRIDITALSEGTATLTLTMGEQTAQFTVNVTGTIGQGGGGAGGSGGAGGAGGAGGSGGSIGGAGGAGGGN
jgi:hypothetical protein